MWMLGHRFLTTNQLLLVPCLLSGKQDNRKTKSALKATQMKADAKRGALGIRVSATPPSLPPSLLSIYLSAAAPPSRSALLSAPCPLGGTCPRCSDDQRSYLPVL